MREIKLTKYAMRVLKPALLSASGAIKREIERGISQLFIADNNKLYIVLRPENKTLVVVAAAGSGLYQSQSEIITYARNNGFYQIRFHTKVPERLKKGLTGLQPELIEIRKKLFNKDEYVFILRV